MIEEKWPVAKWGKLKVERGKRQVINGAMDKDRVGWAGRMKIAADEKYRMDRKMEKESFG